MLTLNMLRRKMRGHLPRGHVDRKPLKLSRWLPYTVRDHAGRHLGQGFREAYLHPTKGLRLGAMPPFFRGGAV